jgi:hypothetical protein
MSAKSSRKPRQESNDHVDHTQNAGHTLWSHIEENCSDVTHGLTQVRADVWELESRILRKFDNAGTKSWLIRKNLGRENTYALITKNEKGRLISAAFFDGDSLQALMDEYKLSIEDLIGS